MKRRSEPDFAVEALVLGYHTYSRFSPIEHLAFTRVFGDFAFSVIFPRLRDPTRLHPAWACKFVGTVLQMPAADMERPGNLFKRVTRSAAWKNCQVHADRFHREFERLLAELPEEIEDFADLHRSTYLDDHARWTILRARRAANRVKNASDLGASRLHASQRQATASNRSTKEKESTRNGAGTDRVRSRRSTGRIAEEKKQAVAQRKQGPKVIVRQKKLED